MGLDGRPFGSDWLVWNGLQFDFVVDYLHIVLLLRRSPT